MSNYESEVERNAGVDMVPVGESFETKPEHADAIVIFFFFVAVFVFLFGFFLVLVGLLAKEHIGPRSGLAGICGLAFVPVELLLEARLRIGSPLKSTHGNFEFSAAKCADSECRSGT